MQKADWHFDFISPYAYFGLLRLPELTGQLEIRYQPILFAGLLNHWGQKGPAEISTKRIWTYQSCTWWAANKGIAFRMPAVHPFNPLPFLRLAIAAGSTQHAVQRIFETLWTTGVDPSEPQVLSDLASRLDVNLSRLSDQDVKDSLRYETEQAVARGVFGVPTLFFANELFWGADATDFAKAYLADPTLFASEEMKRASALPVGASRKRD